MHVLHKRLVLVLIILLLAGPVFAGGGKDSSLSGGSAIDEKREAPESFSILSAFPRQDISFSADWAYDESLLIGQLFGTLVDIHPDSRLPVPSLGESWEVSENGKTYTFTLADIQWSDGSPVKAADFLVSWKNQLNAGRTNPRALFLAKYLEGGVGYLNGLDNLGVRALSDNILEIRFKRAYPYALRLLAQQAFALYPDEWSGRGSVPLGAFSSMKTSGTYVMQPEKDNPEDSKDEIILKYSRDRDKQYQDSFRGPELLRFKMIGDRNEALGLYLDKKADWLTASAFPLPRMAELDFRHDFQNPSGAASYFYIINSSRGMLKEEGNRRLLISAVSRVNLLESLRKGPRIPAETLIPPHLYNDTPFESGLAQTTVESGGEIVGESNPLILIHPTGPGHAAVAENLRSQWKDILGIQIELQSLEMYDFLKLRESGNFDLAFAAWTADSPDAQSFLSAFLSHEPYWGRGWGFSAFDKLVIAAEQLPEGGERIRLQREAESLFLYKEAVVLPLFFPSSPQLLDKKRWKSLTLEKPEIPRLKYLYRL